MPTTPDISGIHHITAVASSAAENLAFYQNILGLRLVKKTVNFDDPHAYHLYYGDQQGAPGTIMTFFPWEELPAGTPGAGMVTAIAFAVPRDAMRFWNQRIGASGRPVQRAERFGDPVLMFSDPHGLPLELIGTDETRNTAHLENGMIPTDHAIHGLHSATATLHSLEAVDHLLVEVMGLTQVAREDKRCRFMTSDHISPGHFYDVVVDPKAPSGRRGGGTVHHIAFRTASSQTQSSWQSRLRQAGLPVSDVRDRKYFQSIYFSSPGGVLFEIATDPPGFAIDEPVETMGSALMLPDQYESSRHSIQNGLPALYPADHQHVFEEAPVSTDDSRTIVSLHGTGGSEHDLLDLAARIAPGSAILSPRGNTLENGMARFFRRLANNVFDEEDIVRRAHELADFLLQAATCYKRSPEHLIACGYSNGANIAAAVLMVRPEIFSSAVLLRPMLPLQDLSMPDLQGKPVLILRGKHDSIIPADSTDQLIHSLEQAGADVQTHMLDTGHRITQEDIDIATRWLADAATAGPRLITATM